MPLLFEPPDDPADTRAWTRAVEDEVSDFVVAEVRRILLQATEDYLASFGSALTAAGDPSAFDGIPAQWTEFTATEFADTMGGLYLNGAVTAFVQAPGAVALTEDAVSGWTRVVNDEAVAYSQSLSNRMKDVGDRMWLDVRSTVTAGVREGMSIDEVAGELRRVGRFSQYRSETIARTEVHAAVNAGKLAGDSGLGRYGPVEKIWLSAGFDSRTRETHLAADGQYVPIDEAFVVGGSSLMFPGDPSGPAREVINCRCTYLRLYPGDTRPDGTVVPALPEPEPATVDPVETEVGVEAAPGARPTVGQSARVRRTSQEIYEERLAEAARVADRYEVTPEEVLMHLDDVPALKRAAQAEARQRAFEVHGLLDSHGLGSIGIPDPSTLDDASRVYFDWFRNLSAAERHRLRLNGWVSREVRGGVDEIDEAYARLFGLESSGLPGQALEEHWLRLNREYDLLQQAGRGRKPRNFDRYGGAPDYNDLLPGLRTEGYDLNVVFAGDDFETAAMIARRTIVDSADEAAALLREADIAVNGPPPWRIGFQAWEEEVRELEYLRRESLPMTRDQIERYSELVPRSLDFGQDYEVLYSSIIETARAARFDVADWAMIPWR